MPDARIIITRPLPGDPSDLLRQAGFSNVWVNPRDERLPRSELLRVIPGAHAVLATPADTLINAEFFDAAGPQLKIVSNYAVGVVLFIILRLATHHFGQLKRPGAVTGLFLFGYGVFRSFVELFREPDANLSNLPLGLTMGILLSAPMWIAGLFLMIRSRKATEPVSVIAAPVESAAPVKKKPASRKPAK